MLSIYLIIALTLYEFSYIPGIGSCEEGELEEALEVELNNKIFKDLCPAGKKKDIEKLESLSTRYDLYLFPYCLFRKQRKRNEEILCESELKPLFKTYKNPETKEDVSCGSKELQLLHFFGYYFCGWMEEAMNKLRSIKKPQHINEYNDEHHPQDIPMYDVCFDISTHETLHTIHSVLQPSVYQEPYFQEQCYCSQRISTDEFYMRSGSFAEIEGNYQAELNKNPQTEFRMFPQPLVPPQHYAYRAWKKSTNHFINRAPLWEHLIPLMNVIDEGIKKASLNVFRFSSGAQELRIYTKVISEPTSQPQPTKTKKKRWFSPSFSGKSLNTLDTNIWHKFVYNSVSQQGIMIYIHNTPGQMDEKCPQDRILSCNFGAWGVDSACGSSESIDEINFNYATCCVVSTQEVEELFPYNSLPMVDYLNIDLFITP